MCVTSVAVTSTGKWGLWDWRLRKRCTDVVPFSFVSEIVRLEVFQVISVLVSVRISRISKYSRISNLMINEVKPIDYLIDGDEYNIFKRGMLRFSSSSFCV